MFSLIRLVNHHEKLATEALHDLCRQYCLQCLVFALYLQRINSYTRLSSSPPLIRIAISHRFQNAHQQTCLVLIIARSSSLVMRRMHFLYK